MRFYTRRDHIPIACADDDRKVIESFPVKASVSLYHIDRDAAELSHAKKKFKKAYMNVRNLGEMADHFLSSSANITANKRVK